jgi:mono/diheme cytochrome c family protein
MEEIMRKRMTSSIAIILLVALASFSVSLPSAAAWSGADPKAGFEVHKKKCLACHGELGKGDGPAASMLEVKLSDWTDKAKMTKLTDDDLLKIINKGGSAVGKSKLMPGFGEKLSKQEIQGLVAYIRSLGK